MVKLYQNIRVPGTSYFIDVMAESKKDASINAGKKFHAAINGHCSGTCIECELGFSKLDCPSKHPGH